MKLIPCVFSFHSYPLHDFGHERTLDFIEGLFCISHKNHVISVFRSIYAMHYICCLTYVDSPPQPWNEATLIIMNDHFDVIEIQFL